jgi:hypothetical protein
MTDDDDHVERLERANLLLRSELAHATGKIETMLEGVGRLHLHIAALNAELTNKEWAPLTQTQVAAEVELRRAISNLPGAVGDHEKALLFELIGKITDP